MFERLMAMLGSPNTTMMMRERGSLEVPVRTEEDLEERQKRVLNSSHPGNSDLPG